MSEETSNPYDEYADNDQGQKSCSYSSHNRFEMTFIFTSSYKSCSLSYVTVFGNLSDQYIALAAFNTCSEINLPIKVTS